MALVRALDSCWSTLTATQCTVPRQLQSSGGHWATGRLGPLEPPPASRTVRPGSSKLLLHPNNSPIRDCPALVLHSVIPTPHCTWLCSASFPSLSRAPSSKSQALKDSRLASSWLCPALALPLPSSTTITRGPWPETTPIPIPILSLYFVSAPACLLTYLLHPSTDCLLNIHHQPSPPLRRTRLNQSYPIHSFVAGCELCVAWSRH